MYHVELRKFPHSSWRFNLSEQELFGSLLAPWVAGVTVEAGERRWNPYEASLTVLEGPQLTMAELAMGRGWRNASRRSEDVTARVLAAARERAGQAGTGVGPHQAGAGGMQAGTGTMQSSASASRNPAVDAERLRELLGEDGETLLGLWLAARKRHPQRTPSECLAFAEDALRSLDER